MPTSRQATKRGNSARFGNRLVEDKAENDGDVCDEDRPHQVDVIHLVFSGLVPLVGQATMGLASAFSGSSPWRSIRNLAIGPPISAAQTRPSVAEAMPISAAAIKPVCSWIVGPQAIAVPLPADQRCGTEEHADGGRKVKQLRAKETDTVLKDNEAYRHDQKQDQQTPAGDEIGNAGIQPMVVKKMTSNMSRASRSKTISVLKKAKNTQVTTAAASPPETGSECCSCAKKPPAASKTRRENKRRCRG